LGNELEDCVFTYWLKISREFVQNWWESVAIFLLLKHWISATKTRPRVWQHRRPVDRF